MAAFGENLRREREMRGVSLEEISAATKISLRILQAIEEEDFAKLPGGIFARSFIRSYARYLGLEEERVMAEYQLAARPSTEVDLVRLTPTSRTPASKSAGRNPLAATLVAVILLAGGYLLYHYSRRMVELPTAPPPNPAATTPPTPEPGAQTPPSTEGSGSGLIAPAGNQAPGATAGGPSGAAAAGGPGGPPGTISGSGAAALPTGQNPPRQTAGQESAAPGGKLTPDGSLVLQVAATERSWVAVDADGKTALQRVLNPNEVLTIKARDSFDVTSGNAQGIILTLNGETLKPMGRRGEVKTVHLTRDDVKSPAP